MLTIDLLRHGETETPGRLIGKSDPALSELGWRQLTEQTAGLHWDAVVCSPRRRTLEPARRLADEASIPLRADADWAELDFGEWEGRSVAEIATDGDSTEDLAALYTGGDAAPPGGESWISLQTRVARALERLLASLSQQRVLVLTHGGPMRAALHLACGLSLTSLWTLRIVPGTRLRLRVGRDEAHGLWGEIVELNQP